MGKNFFDSAYRWAKSVWQPDFQFELVADNPVENAVGTGKLTVVGGPGYMKWAYLKCPCGCGRVTMLSLSKTKRPSWSVKTDWLGRPTVYPSIRELDGCFSHYWITKGLVQWCSDTGRPWRI